MKSSKQQTALSLWQFLPHALLWAALAFMCIVFGYDRIFYSIIPALPLIISLVLAWESPPASLPFSLIATGLAYDLLSGQPLSLSALLWAAVYWWHVKHLRTTDADAPFTSRWIKITYRLSLYVVMEAALAWWLKLNVPLLSEMTMRLMLMALLVPAAAWLVITIRKATYRKLWMFLPPEVKPVG